MFGPGLSGIHLLPEELSKYSGEKKKKTKTLCDRSHLANPTGRKRTSSGLAEGPQEKEKK